MEFFVVSWYNLPISWGTEIITKGDILMSESKALEYTKDITVAILSSRGEKSLYPDESNGLEIAKFIDVIFNKFSELEKK